ncbi:hypothetical protein EU522_01845 [Candidatus Thorarchaeota archaeon]|nr:MAG: hypothetical protein EU522_01845 [Candidatus Thorarchaeota archaeon]
MIPRHLDLGDPRVLKPLGTITMYFKFLEEDIISEVKAIMNQARDHYDFVLQLSERACQDETPTTLIYIAAAHVWHLSVSFKRR